jgi:hypothetical protein
VRRPSRRRPCACEISEVHGMGQGTSRVGPSPLYWPPCSRLRTTLDPGACSRNRASCITGNDLEIRVATHLRMSSKAPPCTRVRSGHGEGFGGAFDGGTTGCHEGDGNLVRHPHGDGQGGNHYDKQDHEPGTVVGAGPRLLITRCPVRSREGRCRRPSARRNEGQASESASFA